jgi:6-phosphofructokinase 2
MSAKDIVTLTMNPAVDLATEVDRVEATHKLRCGPVRRDAGGGGINVARAVRRLGGDPLAIYPGGGPFGHLLDELVRTEDVRYRRVPSRGETRQNIAVTERSTGSQFRFVLPGPALSAQEIGACLGVLAEEAGGGYVVASGGLPPGADSDFYRKAAAIAASRDARFVLDSSGEALKRGLGPGVYLIKPSRRELSELEGQTLLTDDACLAAARRLIASKLVSLVAVSLGESGALLVGERIALRATAPRVAPVSSVGAGDSFLGALVLGLGRGCTLADSLSAAVAAGTASLLSAGTGLCRREDVDHLISKVEVSAI